jgi:hypothetical protein
VIERVQGEFINAGIDEAVLQDLKQVCARRAVNLVKVWHSQWHGQQIWESKLQYSRVLQHETGGDAPPESYGGGFGAVSRGTGIRYRGDQPDHRNVRYLRTQETFSVAFLSVSELAAA